MPHESRIQHPRGAGARRALARAVAAALLAAAARPAAAQTRFVWPDTAVDVAKYETVEECVAAVDRVRRGEMVRARHPVWKDTLPLRPQEYLAPQSGTLTRTAQRCVARFDAARAPVEDANLLIPLYLTAGQDADAMTMVRRRLARFPAAAKSDGERARNDSVRTVFLHDTIYFDFALAVPARVALIDTLEQMIRATTARPMRARTAYALMGTDFQLMGRYLERGDTATGMQYARRVIALADSIPAAERPAIEELTGVDNLVNGIYGALRLMRGRAAELDSLRAGTAAFVRYQNALWQQANGGSGEQLAFPVGKRAAPLVGMVLDADSTVPRPVRGRVNLVMFLDGLCTDVRYDMWPQTSEDQPGGCAPTVAVLRRLASRFPALEITLVDRTRGHFSYAVAESPAAEAALLRQSLAAHRAPGVLVMAPTEFLRLADPDRRRVDRPNPPNYTAYSFGKTWQVMQASGFIVDRDGTIIDAGTVSRDTEANWAQEIEILLGRQTAGH